MGSHSILVLGPRRSGKSSMLLQIDKVEWPPQYDPTIFQTSIFSFNINGALQRFTACDLSGEPESSLPSVAELRGVLKEHTFSGYVFTYDIARRDGLDAVREIQSHLQLALGDQSKQVKPSLLIGHKMSPAREVKASQGLELAQRNGWLFREFSARSHDDTEEAFSHLAKAICAPVQRPQRISCIQRLFSRWGWARQRKRCSPELPAPPQAATNLALRKAVVRPKTACSYHPPVASSPHQWPVTPAKSVTASSGRNRGGNAYRLSHLDGLQHLLGVPVVMKDKDRNFSRILRM